MMEEESSNKLPGGYMKPGRKVSEKQLANIRDHKFVKGRSGNPHGRPKNRINALLKDILPKDKIKKFKQELSMLEVDTIEKQALQLELSDLQLVAKAESTPAYLKALAMAIIIEMKNGKTSTVEKLRDRQYGSVNQKVEMSGGLSFASLLMQSGDDDHATQLNDDDSQDFDEDNI